MGSKMNTLKKNSKKENENEITDTAFTPVRRVKDDVISLRMNKAQIALLDRYREVISKVIGKEVTRTWVMMRLFDLGKGGLEKQYKIDRVVNI
jgi:hypothetical protein